MTSSSVRSNSILIIVSSGSSNLYRASLIKLSDAGGISPDCSLPTVVQVTDAVDSIFPGVESTVSLTHATANVSIVDTNASVVDMTTNELQTQCNAN